ncbi:MAG: 16S rRNA (cytosine967-C5)-methyltransferase [Candidatus Paceibacteria bacterium]|jgi:16S rRNA (cytosine967-C5)-methyltransferase
MTRHVAWNLMRSGSAAPTQDVAQACQDAELDSRDRGLVARMVRTEIQRRGTLHALVQSFANGKPNRDLSAFLRLGFTQLLFMDRVPNHAAVSETVRAASDELGLSKGRYVNGVLRTALRAMVEESSGDPRRDIVGRSVAFNFEIFHDPEQHPLLWAEEALSIPATLYKGWLKRHGEDLARSLAEGALGDPRLSMRVVRGTRAEQIAEFTELGFSTECGQHGDILTAAPEDLEQALASEAFTSGRVTVQGEAALRAAELCGAKAGERWLDLCAAPGGKTAVLALTGASVLACDVNEAKLDRLSQTLERLNALEHVETRVLEDRMPPLETDFDGVLLDVPCSNTGVLARRPEARWRYGPKTRRQLAEVQSELLRHGAERVRPGGALVYSTCSLEPDENQQRVKSFLEEFPGWTLEQSHLILPQSSDAGGPVDGGFAARLIRAHS